MSSTGEIRIVYAYLDTMRLHMSTAYDALGDNSTLTDLAFTGNQDVESAYGDFLGEWDKHRNKLHEGIGSTRDAFQLVSESFLATDDALAAEVAGNTAAAAEGE